MLPCPYRGLPSISFIRPLNRTTAISQQYCVTCVVYLRALQVPQDIPGAKQPEGAFTLFVFVETNSVSLTSTCWFGTFLWTTYENRS